MWDFLGQKTFWAGLALVGTGIFQIVGGSTDEGIKTIVQGAAVIFMRQAIAKTTQNKTS